MSHDIFFHNVADIIDEVNHPYLHLNLFTDTDVYERKVFSQINDIIP